MDELVRIKHRKIIISLLIFSSVLVILTIFIVNRLSWNSMIINSGSENLKQLSNSDFERVQREVSAILENSYNMSQEEIRQTQIMIRESSLTLEEVDGRTVAKFIIDLSNPEVTYAGQLTVGRENEDIHLSCPELSLAKNPKVFCMGYDRQSTIDAVLSKYLPYQGVTKKGLHYSLWKDYKDDEEPRLEAYANLCGSEERKADLDESISEWLNDKGVGLDVIPLFYSIDYCSNE